MIYNFQNLLMIYSFQNLGCIIPLPQAAVNAFFTAPLFDPAGITFSTLNLTVLDSGLHRHMAQQ